MIRNFAQLLPLLLSACAQGAPGHPSAAGPMHAPEFPYRDHVAFAAGRIGDSETFWFLIDTGGNRSAIDSVIVRELELEILDTTTVQGSMGTIIAQVARLPGLDLDGLAITDLEPVVRDLSGSLAPEGTRIAGILGFDVLKDYAILFDISGERLLFGPSAASLVDTTVADRVPFELDNGIPRIEAVINDVPVELRLDTGASIAPGPVTFVNIPEQFFQRLKNAEPSLEPFRHFTAIGVGGEIRIPVVKGRSFRLGKMEVTDPQLIVQPPIGYFADPGAVGFIGSYALQNVSMFVVDYPQRRLILIP